MSSRIANDAYFTPSQLIRSYFATHAPFIGKYRTILEPCVGDGGIANPLRELGYQVEGTDIVDGDEFDATKLEYWHNKSPDWVITNPPFNQATPIIEHSLKHAKHGVIMLLRSSYLEPCKDRRHLLDNRIRQITYCNPRPKFRTDIKGSDSSTVVFIVWDKYAIDETRVNYLVDWNHKS